MTALWIAGYVVLGVLTAYSFVKLENPRATDDYGQEIGPDLFMPMIMALLWPFVVCLAGVIAIWCGFGWVLHKIAGNA